MNILLLYATYSGGTLTASHVLTDSLTSLGHSVTMQDVHEQEPSVLDNHDLVVLASPSWEFEGKDGHPHVFYMEFMKKAEEKTMPGAKFAVMGLGDTAYPNFCGVVKHLEEFTDKLQAQRIVDSLRIDGYFFNEEEHNKRIEEWAKQVSEKLS